MYASIVIFFLHTSSRWVNFMNRLFKAFSIPAAFCLILTITQSVNGEDWLRFRGPNGSGVSSETQELVTEFGDDKNLNWKVELPGSGASSPIVVGEKIFVTCYSGYGESRTKKGEMEKLKRHLVCVDRAKGKILWEKDFDPYLPEDKFTGMGVPEHGYSSSTPVSDGKHVFVFFGKSGVFAFDLEGKQIWKKSVGTASGSRKWGSAASPILAEGVLVVVASDEDEAIYGLEPATGNELWKTKTPDVANVWNSPIITGKSDDAQLLISVPKKILALDPKTGNTKWYATNGVDAPSVSTSLVMDGDNVIAMGGRTRTCTAWTAGGKDDVTESHTVWTGRAISSVVTPIAYQGRLYCIGQGIASCADAKTGETIFKERVAAIGSGNGRAPRRGPGGMDYSSPVIAAGKIYQFTKSGTCYVMAAKPEFELLATNKFESDDSEFNGTPAVSDGEMFVRSNKFLYSIGKKQSK